MRALDCPCGLTLTAEDDDALYVAGRRHADEHHADQNIPDDFIRHVRDNARDVDVRRAEEPCASNSQRSSSPPLPTTSSR